MKIAIVFAASTLLATSAYAEAPRAGLWRAWLDSPGGELPFELELESREQAWRAWIVNGAERIEVPTTTWTGDELALDIDYYDSVIRAKPSADGARLDGEWTKRRGREQWLKMRFHATAGAASRFPDDGPPTVEEDRAILGGRWAVRFGKDAEPAIGIFDCRADGITTGTFLTTTGDFRYLCGRLSGHRLRLSCFDGAHAFLFDAKLGHDAMLAGDFWSGDRFHDTWNARRDPDAKLPDAFELARATGKVALADLSFPDPDGRRVSLGDSPFVGKAVVIEVFGTWCPNCRDATQYLVELDERYRGKGLAIVGLAFELTGDAKRDAEQVKKYAARHGVSYPLLVTGISDKAKASAALPFLDRIRAYPTLIFVDRDGVVAAVYSGFSGPATGPANAEMRARIEAQIDGLLKEK